MEKENNEKRYTAKDKIYDIIEKVKNGVKSDRFKKVLRAGVGITCIAAGVYSQNHIATNIGKNIVKDVAIEEVVNVGKDFINKKLNETIDLTEERVKTSDIEEQEQILDKEMDINKDSIQLE